jgi:hypothetical protein
MTGIDPLLHRTQEQTVIRRVRISAQELVVDDIITRVDLAMSFALIVIPDTSALLGNTVLINHAYKRWTGTAPLASEARPRSVVRCMRAVVGNPSARRGKRRSSRRMPAGRS